MESLTAASRHTKPNSDSLAPSKSLCQHNNIALTPGATSRAPVLKSANHTITKYRYPTSLVEGKEGEKNLSQERNWEKESEPLRLLCYSANHTTRLCWVANNPSENHLTPFCRPGMSSDWYLLLTSMTIWYGSVGASRVTHTHTKKKKKKKKKKMPACPALAVVVELSGLRDVGPEIALKSWRRKGLSLKLKTKLKTRSYRIRSEIALKPQNYGSWKKNRPWCSHVGDLNQRERKLIRVNLKGCHRNRVYQNPGWGTRQFDMSGTNYN